jgi:hypothetical protein
MPHNNVTTLIEYDPPMTPSSDAEIERIHEISLLYECSFFT